MIHLTIDYMTPIEALLERPIAYNSVIAKATGSVKLTILWCQMNYWTDKSRDDDGWVYKTQKDIWDETGLGRREQETAREIGLELGVMSTMIKGVPPVVHFKVHRDKMVEVIEKYLNGQPKPEKKERVAKKENSIEWLNMIPAEDIKDLMEKFSVTAEFIGKRAQDVIDYCESKGKRYANYKAALRNFIKSHMERHGTEEKKGAKKDIRALVDKALMTPRHSTEWGDIYSELKQNKVAVRLDGDPAIYADGVWKVKGAQGWVEWSMGLQGHLTLVQT